MGLLHSPLLLHGLYRDFLACPLPPPSTFFRAGRQPSSRHPSYLCVGLGFSGTSGVRQQAERHQMWAVQIKSSGPAAASHGLLPQSPSQVTYVDVFQIQEVQGEPIALPDDGWPQVSLDSARQHCAQPHSHCGHTDPLLGGKAELNHLCREKEKPSGAGPGAEFPLEGYWLRGFPAGQGPRQLQGNCPPHADETYRWTRLLGEGPRLTVNAQMAL